MTRDDITIGMFLDNFIQISGDYPGMLFIASKPNWVYFTNGEAIAHCPAFKNETLTYYD